MGGKKKLSLKQMERAQSRKGKEKKKKEKTERSKENAPVEIIPPDTKNEKIIGELKKMRVLTPYAVASRFNVRISAAKSFLEQLKDRGLIQIVSGNHTLKIYKMAD